MKEKELQKQRKDSFITLLNLIENDLITDEIMECWQTYEMTVNTCIFCEDALKEIEEGTVDCDEEYKQVYVEDMEGSYYAANEFNNRFHEMAKAVENNGGGLRIDDLDVPFEPF